MGYLERQMTTLGKDVLLVGQDFRNGQVLADQLRRWGFRCHFANNMRVAKRMVSSMRIHVVLSNTHLPDGTGLRLAAILAGLPVTAFVCVPVEDTCFWLPAVDDGKACLGLPSLRPSEFASALEEMARGLTGSRVDEPMVKARSRSSRAEGGQGKDNPVYQTQEQDYLSTGRMPWHTIQTSK